MPDRATIKRWLRDPRYRDFCAQYAQACENRDDDTFDEIIEIADDGTQDFVEKAAKDGTKQVAFNYENVQRSRLRIDARKWVLARRAPRKYSERSIAHSIDEPPPEQIDSPRERIIAKLEAMAERIEIARNFPGGPPDIDVVLKDEPT